MPSEEQVDTVSTEMAILIRIIEHVTGPRRDEQTAHEFMLSVWENLKVALCSTQRSANPIESGDAISDDEILKWDVEYCLAHPNTLPLKSTVDEEFKNLQFNITLDYLKTCNITFTETYNALGEPVLNRYLRRIITEIKERKIEE